MGVFYPVYWGLPQTMMGNPFLTNQHRRTTEDEQDETWQIQILAMDTNFRNCPGIHMVLDFIWHVSTFITTYKMVYKPNNYTVYRSYIPV